MARKKKNNVPDLTQEFRNNSYNPYNPYQQPGAPYQQPGPYEQSGYNAYPQYPQQQPPLEQKIVSDENTSKKRKKDRNNKPTKSRIEQHGQEEMSLPSNDPVDDEEKTFRSRSRNKKIVRGTLVVLNFALLAYLVFSIASLIKGAVTKGSNDAESFINICGLSKKESNEVYNKYLKEDADGKLSATTINDYAIYGNNLYVSGLAITNTTATSFQNLYYVNVCAKSTALVPVPSSLDYIDLAHLAEGDYLIIAEKEGKNLVAGKYSGNKALKETFYLRSQESGNYKEITIKNNVNSPALVICVKDITTPSNNHIDIVFYADNSDKVPTLSEKYKSKVCLKEEGLECVYQARATYAIDLTSTTNETASFDRNLEGFTKTPVIISGIYSGFEESLFIRELGGYMTKSGSCLDEDTCHVKPYLDTYNRGSKAYTINKSLDSDTIKNLVERILLA